MSLLHSQEYVIHHLRTRYLKNYADGVGERIISINPNSISGAAARAGGYLKPEDLKRSFSPPISAEPTYLGANPRATTTIRGEGWKNRIKRSETMPNMSQRDAELSDDDGSDDGYAVDPDLEDEGEEMLFTKVPIPRRDTGDSLNAPQVTVTAPSRSNSHRSDIHRSQPLPLRAFPQFRNALQTKQEYYTTSSEDELDNLHPLNQDVQKNNSEMDIYMEARDISHSGDDSEASESSVDFAETVGSAVTNTILGFDIDEEKRKFSRPKPIPKREPSTGHFSPIPLTTAQSIRPPVSALTALIKAKEQNSHEENHLAELYASFSGKGDLKPLHLKIYRPTSDEPMRPVDVIVRQDATVAETIGFSLYRYWEEGRKPALKKEECDANVWTLRIMEDEGVVDDDFPALERIRPISRFQFDMFALVEATSDQVKQNIIETPTRVLKSPTLTVATSPSIGTATPTLTPAQQATAGRPSVAIRRGSNSARSILLRIRLFPYVESGAQSTMLDVTSDNYFSEVLDLICKKLHLEKSLYVLRLPGTSIMIPPSRRVESLQGRTELELIRKNALEALSAGGSGAGTPISSGTSRIMPFYVCADLVTGAGHKKRKKLLLRSNLGDQSDLITNASYQKYIVWRRQPIFGRNERVLAIDGDYIHIMPSDQKTMYEPGNPKTSSIFIGAIVSAKQSRKIPQNFKIMVLKARETKRYEFEAVNSEQALEIVNKIRTLMNAYNKM